MPPTPRLGPRPLPLHLSTALMTWASSESAWQLWKRDSPSSSPSSTAPESVAEVLKQVAVRLLKHCRSEDTVCRTGGDEFLYLLIDPKGRDNIERIASALVETLASPVVFEGLEIFVKPSIGVSLYPEHGTSASELIRSADAAMYAAKKNSDGPRWAFHDGAPMLGAA